MTEVQTDGETMEIVVPRTETPIAGKPRNAKLGASNKGYSSSAGGGNKANSLELVTEAEHSDVRSSSTKGGGIASLKVGSREQVSSSKSGMGERGKLSSRSKGVKITWQPGPEKVDRFYINYGSEAKKLNKQVVVDSRDVKVGTHPIYGPILTYTIKDVDPNFPLFFSIMSENKSGRSLPSEVLELPVAK